MTKWKILWFLLSLSVLAVFGGVASYLQARVFISNPVDQRKAVDESPADYGMDYETITLTTTDGYDLAAWYIPSQNRAAVIVVHGYKSDRSDVLSRAQVLVQNGYGALLPDLRAHGESSGVSVTFGLNEVRDVEAAYQYLLTRPDVDPERIGAMGVSMGGDVVLLHAAQNPGIKAVVSESAFASLDDAVSIAVAETGLPPFLFASLVQYFAEQQGGFQAKDISAVAQIGKISPRPVLLLQGGADWTVPADSGQRLYDVAGEPRDLWFDPDLGHVRFLDGRPEEFEKRVVGLFDQYLLGTD